MSFYGLSWSGTGQLYPNLSSLLQWCWVVLCKWRILSISNICLTEIHTKFYIIHITQHAATCPLFSFRITCINKDAGNVMKDNSRKYLQAETHTFWELLLDVFLGGPDDCRMYAPTNRQPFDGLLLLFASPKHHSVSVYLRLRSREKAIPGSKQMPTNKTFVPRNPNYLTWNSTLSSSWHVG